MNDTKANYPKTITLSTGNKIPILGLGTCEQLWGEEAKRRGHFATLQTDSILLAFEVGYRHVDSAILYGNHESIGKAIQESGLNRSEIFVTSKVYRADMHHKGVIQGCEQALRELQSDYLDLYLIHWPNDDIHLAETLGAFKLLVEQGKVKDVGVANFTTKNLKKALDIAEVPISVNQVEYHPYLNQTRLLDFCRAHKITLTGYAPIAQGKVVEEPCLVEIGNNHGKSSVQVSLRWLVQKGLVVIPKATSRSHLEQNFDIFDWELSSDEMQRIESIEERKRIFKWHVAGFDPTTSIYNTLRNTLRALVTS